MNPTVPFVKMVGTGNDFLIVDAVHRRLNALTRQWPAIARTACDRRYGVGADGLLLLEPSQVGDLRMRVFNPDGSEAEMCGNGARCVVHLVQGWSDHRRDGVLLETAAGIIQGRVKGNRVQIQMSPPKDVRLNRRVNVDGQSYRVASINTGVDHAVLEVRNLDRCDVEGLGRALRFHAAFRPHGTNVDFVATSRNTPQTIRVRTYERGVETETLACGTGATASAILYALLHPRGQREGGALRRITVIPRSGERLTVSFRLEAPERIRDVMLEGPVRRICEGVAQC